MLVWMNMFCKFLLILYQGRGRVCANEVIEIPRHILSSVHLLRVNRLWQLFYFVF